MRSNKATGEEKGYTHIDSLSVTRAREGRKGLVFFDMLINGVFINGMSVVAGEHGDFLSFPSHKGADGNWYHYAWVRLSPDDVKRVLDDVQKKLDE